MSILTKTRLQQTLKTRFIGRSVVEIHDRIDSTNLRARELGLANAETGTLIIGETQTAGRGRLGRTWHSPPGRNLYFSILLPALDPPERSPLVTLAAGLGAADAVRRCSGLMPAIKWPNDLLLDNLKLAGILTEMESFGSEAPFLILGIGLNVNLKREDLPPELTQRACSLHMASGRIWDRTTILAAVLEEVEKNYTALAAGDTDSVLARYRRSCATLGAWVRVDAGTSIIEGKAVTIDERGRLVVERRDGEQTAVDSGEVTLGRRNPESQ